MWEGDYTQPQTLDRWVYAANDPVDSVDPSGLQQFKIWASAFISPPDIVFPHLYIPKYWDPTYKESVFNVPVPAATLGTFHGDGRGFYAGGSRPSARVWHEVTIETNPALPAVVTNDADTATTMVSFVYSSLPPLTNPPAIGPSIPTLGYGSAQAKAPQPPRASVTRTGAVTKVEIDLYASPVSGKNPLELPAEVTPPIRYRYTLDFDVSQGTLTFEGAHSLYPWHELYVSGVPEAAVRFEPNGRTRTPLDLFDTNDKQIGPKTFKLPVYLAVPAGVNQCR